MPSSMPAAAFPLPSITLPAITRTGDQVEMTVTPAVPGAPYSWA
jgi:hypothetical protein